MCIKGVDCVGSNSDLILVQLCSDVSTPKKAPHKSIKKEKKKKGCKWEIRKKVTFSTELFLLGEAFHGTLEPISEKNSSF